MTTTAIKQLVDDWIAAGNKYDTELYLQKYQPDAVLDDPSVGEKFTGHAGIRDYFTRYFIGYQTQTRLVKLTIQNNKAHLEVEFKGKFPEGTICGLFDMTFADQKIAAVKANLIT